MPNKFVNVNEQIQDRTIRHMVFLERYKAGQVRRVAKVLDREILPEIQSKLEKRLNRIIERGSDLGSVTTARLKELEKELRTLADDLLAKKIREEILIDLKDLTRDELEWQVNVIREELKIDLDLVVPNPIIVAAVAKRTAFAGLTLDQWFGSLSRSTQRNVMTAVNRGIVEGETTEQIIRRIRGTKALNYTDGVFQTTRRQAEAITRSTVNHVTNQARIELFKENDDIVKGLKWTATLDSRTSLTCAGLDGKVFPLDKGPRPPAHPNCRSTMTAVLKDWKTLGLTGLDEGTRASINGQVPASTTFGAWLKDQPASVQKEVLGATRAKLFNEGKLDISRFTDSRLQPLSLKELSRLEKKAFKDAEIKL